MSSHYINTDVDIVSSRNLEDLKFFLEAKSDLLYGEALENGNWIISIEAEGSGILDSEGHNLETDLKKLIALLSQAQSEFPNEFQSLKKFDFNIGWHSSKERPNEVFTISNKFLGEVSKLGATISVTIYPADESEDGLG